MYSTIYTVDVPLCLDAVSGIVLDMLKLYLVSNAAGLLPLTYDT